MALSRFEYGTLIAKFISEKQTEDEEMLLHDWMNESPDNWKLFEDLTNGWKAAWAQQWFREAGVNTNFISWKKHKGWYTVEPKSHRNNYIILVLAILLLLAILFFS